MFTPVGSLLNSLPKRSKVPEAIVALHARRAFDEALLLKCPDLPEDVLKKVKATIFKSGTLSVQCPSLVAAELSMRAGGLIGAINKTLGRRVVLRLRFRVG